MQSTLERVKPLDFVVYGSRTFTHYWRHKIWTDVEVFFKCKNGVYTFLDGEIHMPCNCYKEEVAVNEIPDLDLYFKNLEYFIENAKLNLE